MRAVTRAGLFCKAYNTLHGRQERQENCRQESACTDVLGRWLIDCLREVDAGRGCNRWREEKSRQIK